MSRSIILAMHWPPIELHQKDFRAVFCTNDFLYIDLLKSHFKKRDLHGSYKLHDSTLEGGRPDLHQKGFRANYCRDDFPFVDLLKVCAKKKDLDGAIKLHDSILERGLLVKSPYLASTLINVYAKCGVLAKAQEVFEEFSTRDTITWNALISGYVQVGRGHQALTCFQRMQNEGLLPDVVTFTCILKACGITGDLNKGKQVHGETEGMKILEKDIILGTALIDMYARCGELVQAKIVLRNLSIGDVISWNALLAGCAQQGEYHEVLSCFECMQNEGLCPDPVTFVYILNACGSVRAIEKGQQIHEEIILMCTDLLQKDVVIGNALVDMYAKCGMLVESLSVLEGLLVRNAASWNALIAGYAEYGQFHETFNCFDQMQIEGISPDVVTFTCILKACGSTEDIDKGRQIHNEVASRGLINQSTMLGNSLVDMYSKCSDLTESRQVLHKFKVRDIVAWNILITGYAKEGCIYEAINCKDEMESDGISPDSVTFICILKASARTQALESGKSIHIEIVMRGFLHNDVILGNALMDMYAQCGVLSEARRILEELPMRNVVSWNVLIAGLVRLGRGQEALDCCEEMREEGLSPDVVTFICILKACSITRDVDKGKQIHEEVEGRGLLEEDDLLGSALVDMYAKCGLLSKAQKAFQMILVRNIVSWSALIAGYVQDGQSHEALACFEKMQSEGFSPDAGTFNCILKACGKVEDRNRGLQVYKQIVIHGFLKKDVLLGIALVDMCIKHDLPKNAQWVLQELPVQSILSSSALAPGYVEQGNNHKDTNFAKQMQGNSISSNTVICILRACGSTGAVKKGEEIHDELEVKGLLQNNVEVGNALMDMYAKCGLSGKAHKVFNVLHVRDSVSWNTLISGYNQSGEHRKALNFFQRMQNEAVCPDSITFTCILKACSKNEVINKEKQIQSMIMASFLVHNDSVLGTALIDTCIKSGFLAKAQQVLEQIHVRDVISWNALILGCVEYERGGEALNCFECMQNEGLSPDVVTFICVLKACGSIGAVDKGEEIHAVIVNRGLLEKEIVLGNTLVYMYVKCGCIVKALKVMEDLPVRNEVSWTAVIGGYAQLEDGREALACYEKMQNEGISANAVTFISILRACAIIGAIAKGEQIHKEIVERDLLAEGIMLGNALVDMYAKCGMVTKAAQVLKGLPIRNVITWNALIAGYAQGGHGQEALDCFERMQRESITPDEITFLCILSACSHSGLHKEAEGLFSSMAEKYGIMPSVEHQACMAMVLAFAGLFSKAMSMVDTMPAYDFMEIWLALLDACRKWGNVKHGRLAFERAVQVDSSCAAPYVLMASIYIAAGMQEHAQKVEAMKLRYACPQRKQHFE